MSRQPHQLPTLAPRPRRSKQPATLDARENWTNISDITERRRMQNRNAQRDYRKRMKERLEGLEKRVLTSRDPSPQSITSTPLYSIFETTSQASTPPVFEFEETERDKQQYSFSSPSLSTRQYSEPATDNLDLAEAPWPQSFLYPMGQSWNSGSEYSCSSTDGQAEHYDESFSRLSVPSTMFICSSCGSCNAKEYSFPATMPSSFELGRMNTGQNFTI